MICQYKIKKKITKKLRDKYKLKVIFIKIIIIAKYLLFLLFLLLINIFYYVYLFNNL